ncbi:adenylate kinase [Diplonema papillatum]|nr:adenylate kinase [Diplonema papillatum]
MAKLRMLLIGPPGCGKSFYGKMISKAYDVPFVSMGKILGSRVDASVLERMRKGLLAPPEAVTAVFKSLAPEFKEGFVLDGFPRSREQVRTIIDVGSSVPTLMPDFALNINLRKDVLKRKLLGRRECSCGANWNVEHVDEDGCSAPAVWQQRSLQLRKTHDHAFRRHR